MCACREGRAPAKSRGPGGRCATINLEYVFQPTPPARSTSWATAAGRRSATPRPASCATPATTCTRTVYVDDTRRPDGQLYRRVGLARCRYQQLLGQRRPHARERLRRRLVREGRRPGTSIDEDGDQWLDADPSETRTDELAASAPTPRCCSWPNSTRVTERIGTTFDCWFSERSLYVPDGAQRARAPSTAASIGHGREGLRLRAGRRHLVRGRPRSTTRRTA